ncbi:MAG: hypothetical protein LUD47_06675 [Clostridia bacterium]|nr:hypothetical protein [Clostridia bacterium]
MENGIRVRDILNKKIKGPRFKAEFDSLLSDYALGQALQAARKNRSLTQK